MKIHISGCYRVPFHLKEAVGPCDAVEAEDSHVKESQAQPSISHRVLHVSHPSLVQVVLKLMGIGQNSGIVSVTHVHLHPRSPAMLNRRPWQPPASPAACPRPRPPWPSAGPRRRSGSDAGGAAPQFPRECSTFFVKCFVIKPFLSNVCSDNFFFFTGTPPKS